MAASISDEDDFAAEPVPDAARTSWPPIFFATLGIATSLFNMQIFSLITASFGGAVAVCSIIYAGIVSMVLGRIVASNAIRTGFGLNLFARRVLGYRGASLFSLPFGIATLVLFGAEANIMASSIGGLAGGIPIAILLPAVCMIMVPLVWFGMSFLAKLQLVTFVFYCILLAAALYISWHHTFGARDWLHYVPKNSTSFGTGLLTALGVTNGTVFPTVLVTADYARYVRRSEHGAGQWWVGVGFQFCSFGLAGLAGLWFATRYSSSNPGLYFITMLGSLGTIFVIATQLRINAANMYSGSLAFVNVFRQAFNVRVSRHGVVFFFGVIVSVGLVLDLLPYLMAAMNVIGMLMLCFAFLLITDLCVVRPVRPDMEGTLPYRSGAIEAWHLPAVLSTVAATVVGGVLINGLAGEAAAKWASFAAGGSQVVLYLAAMKSGRRMRRLTRETI
jgi:purine-cytosine permease-like protein